MKKFLMFVLALAFVCPLLWFSWQNKTNLSMLLYLWGAFFIGFIVSFCLARVFKNTKDLKAYKNKYEQISVDNEIHSDKVKVLEEKVKSLEIALSKALER